MKIKLNGNDFISIEIPEEMTLNEASALGERLKKTSRLFAEEIPTASINHSGITRRNTGRGKKQTYSISERRALDRLYNTTEKGSKFEVINARLIEMGKRPLPNRNSLHQFKSNNRMAIQKYEQTNNETGTGTETG